MYREVKIGDKTVGMLSTAASPIRYKKVFGRDFLRMVQSKEGPPPDVFVEMMYIMAMSAEKKPMDTLTEDDYVAWLDQFEDGMFELYGVMPVVQDLIAGSMRTTSVPKGKGA